MLTSAKRALNVGDVIVVRHVVKKDLTDDNEQFDRKLDKEIPEGVPLFRLEQEPELQSALVSIDPHRQYLTAMVGGYDFDANEFNRAFQACRQPGSSFKPLVYSAALEQLELDGGHHHRGLAHRRARPGERGARGSRRTTATSSSGDVLLRTALVNSMNIPAVKTFAAVGVKNMAEWSTKLGLTTPMNMDFSAALGSSCVYPYDLANVYAVFNRYGRKKPTYFIRKIEDRFGRTLEDHTAYDDAVGAAAGPGGGGLRAALRAGRAGDEPRDGLHHSPDLLRGVVTRGHGRAGAEAGQAGGGQDGHHQRLVRHLVRRLHARPGDGGVGGLRQERAPAGPLRDGWPRVAAHLARLHEAGAGGASPVRVLAARVAARRP